MALAAAAYFIPAQSDDSSAAGIGDYEILGTTETYDDLKSVFDFINGDGGIDYTIIVKSNDEDVTSFVLNAGISVILTSSDGKQFILKISAGRHGTVNGSLTLENIILDGNNKACDIDENCSIGEYGYGGGIEVTSGGELTIQDGAVIQNCSAGNGGGVYNYGTFTMKGGEISDNYAAIYGGGVYNDYGSAFNMIGGEISDNYASIYGGGVYNDYGSAFNMIGGEISGNTAKDYGGGVCNDYGSTFNMIGGEISGNMAIFGRGGGVYNYGTFNMIGGEISGNTAQDCGGGVCNGSTFNMIGVEIRGNTADYGGGVYNYGTFTMEGSKISGNTAGYGGGVHNSGGTFNMIGDTVISGNTANSGGGVYNSGNTFTMEGGKISDNTARSGGGVYNWVGNTFTMEGGEISGNAAQDYGGGVYNFFSIAFNMSGDAVISGNTASSGGGVYNSGVYNDGSKFSMSGDAVISGNTANYDGGGIYNEDGLISIIGGKISGNTAKGTGDFGSGGGIYTTNLADLTVDGTVFSGNYARTLRVMNIAASDDIDQNGTYDVKDYEKNIVNVILDPIVDAKQNAPAYNNYDIGYPGDTYVVQVDIKASGSVTVTVTDGSGTVNVIMTSYGWVYVPSTVSSITLSASPESGREFVQFFIDGVPESSSYLADVPISKGMYVIAEFKSLPAEDKKYLITAAADDGSVIDPNGKVSVLEGDSKKFTFSAKSGYQIAAVYVDGIAILPEDLESGEYAFSNITANHTIGVVSNSVGGGNNGSGGSNGGGDGEVSSGGGSNGGNNGSGSWYALNLICAVLALFTGIIAVVAGRNSYGKDSGEKGSKPALMLRILALTIGLIAVAVFFLTEHGDLPAAPTLLMFILFLAALVLTMVSFRYDKAPRMIPEI